MEEKYSFILIYFVDICDNSLTVHSHPGSDKTTEETEMYFPSNLHKELISKKVVRDKQTENSTIKQTSLLIWRKHEKQPNQMACGQQQTTVKTTACSACSKPTSDLEKIYIGSGSEKATTKLKIWLVLKPRYLCSALLQWAENHRLPQARPDALNSTRHWHELFVRTVRGEKVSGAKMTSSLQKEQHMTSMLVTMVRPPTRQ